MARRNFAQYFQLNKFLLQVCGVMPLASSYCVLQFLPVLSTFVAIGFLCLPAMHAMFFHWQTIDLQEKAAIFTEYTEFLAVTIQVLVLLPKRQKIRELAASCSEMWTTVREGDHCGISMFADSALFLTYGFCSSIAFAILNIMMTPLTSNFVVDDNGTVLLSKQLPYSAGIFHDNIRSYHIWYGLQIPASIMSNIPVAAIDSGVGFFILHACAQARLCQIEFERMTEAGNYDRASMIACICRHQKLLEFAQDIEAIFSNVFLIQTILSIFVICGFTFAPLLVGKDEYFKYFTFVIAAMAQLWIFCWPPHVLGLETVRVGHAAYSLPWYTWPKEEHKSVAIVIVRSQIPATVTAGKFSVVSIDTFSSICSTALSMFTVLRAVVE